ncbi:MAG: DPP IV N-terminal domain-containing protein, partial [Edaphobacter sp.]
MFVRKGLLVAAGIGLGCCFTAIGMGQGRQLTTEDYARAEKFMAYNVNSLVYHGVARPTWMEDGRFWYRDNGPDGATFVVVDPAKGTKGPAFDQAKLASALTAATAGKMKADAQHLVISEISFSNGDKTVEVGNGARKFRCDLSGAGVCTEVVAAGAKPGEAAAAGRSRAGADVSPDKKKAAFIRDWNLWVRDTATGKETQLTTDGVKDFGYATDNAGWQMSDNPILVWSPDSKKIATFQQDQRKTGHALGFAQKDLWIFCVMQDVGEQHNIERFVFEREVDAVELLNRDVGVLEPIFPEPDALLTSAPRLPGADGRKMSKSYGNAIFLTDGPQVVSKKLSAYMTDPARQRRTDPGDPDKCP